MDLLAPLDLLAFETVNGRWRPGIGDPTPVGWLTVVAYLGAALLCWRTLRAERRLEEPARRLVLFWALMTVGMLALGINKQLDLQSFFTQVGRSLARRGGWYESRGDVQRLFILALVCGAVGALLTMLCLLRHHLRAVGVALLGGVFVLTFVVVRAASFHHVDVLLNSRLEGVRLNWVFELGGIALVAWGARIGRRAAATREP